MLTVHIALTVICLVLGILQLLEKGPLLTRAYIFALKKEREKMKKKPYYRRSGIIFLMMAVFFGLSIFYVLEPNRMLVYAMGAVALIAILYGTIAGLKIEKENRED